MTPAEFNRHWAQKADPFFPPEEVMFKHWEDRPALALTKYWEGYSWTGMPAAVYGIISESPTTPYGPGASYV